MCLNGSREETFGTSPAFTLWNNEGWKDLNKVSKREFTTLKNALFGAIGEFILISELVMFDILEQKYYKIQFTEWPQGGNGSGFTYYRELIQ
jgi:hypothetical protein